MKVFKLNQKVRLSAAMRRVCTHPERYQDGIVTWVGFWGTYHVQWKGFPLPIMMKEDEIEGAEDDERS